MGETMELSGFVEETSFSQLPPEVVQKAKNVILDTLGCAIAGYTLAQEEFRWIFDPVKEMGGAPESTVFITGLKTSAPQAALVNGTLIHTIDFDDTHMGSIAHLGASVVSSGLAMAEKTKADGRAFLTATVLAYEVAGRIGRAVMPSHYRYWHPTGTLGTIGAGVAAAKLMGLGGEQIDQAISLSADGASGLRYGIDCGDFSKSLHPGLAAWNGIMAARIIHRGAHGPRGLLEYPSGFCRAYSEKPVMEALTDQLGTRYEIMNDSLKAFPTIMCSHTPIQGVIKIATEHRLHLEDVEWIHCRISPTAPGQGMNYSPETPLAARLSIPYCVTMALAKREITMDQFKKEKIVDPMVRAFMKKITIESDPAFTQEYPGTLAAHVELKTNQGSIFREKSIFPKGHPQNPMNEQEVKDKFRRLSSYTLPRPQGEKIIEAVLGLDDSKDLQDLVSLLGKNDLR